MQIFWYPYSPQRWRVCRREKEELELAKELGVFAHNVVGFDKPTIERAIALADQYPEVYLTLGWHPTEAGDYSPEVEAYLVEQLKHPKVVALGEIGLDYHWMTAPKRRSRKGFSSSDPTVQGLGLAFVVHTRDALEDTYAIIKSEGVGPRGGIMHSFSGSLEEAKRFMDLGMMISFFLEWWRLRRRQMSKKPQLAFRSIRSWLRQMPLIWHQFLSGAGKIKQPTPAM